MKNKERIKEQNIKNICGPLIDKQSVQSLEFP